MSPPSATSARLACLRRALEAIPLPDEDLPHRDRLVSTLTALDPALADHALDPIAWVERTGMPSAAWLHRAAEARRGHLASLDQADLPDEGLVHATAMDPEFGQTLIQRRTFLRYLRRHPLFRPQAKLRAEEDGSWFTVDGALADGRWVRLRLAGDRTFPVELSTAWLEAPILDVIEGAGTDVRRTTLGPAWVGEAGWTRSGLHVTRETGALGTERWCMVPAGVEAALDAGVVRVDV